MTKLQVGEHVDLDTGLTIKRTMEDEYLIKDRKHDTSVCIYGEEIRKLDQLAGFVSRKETEIKV